MHDVLKFVAGLPELFGAEVEQQLSSGPLSSKWLLTSDTGQWVLRIDKPLVAGLKLERNSEFAALAALSASGWGSNIVWGDARQGALVVRFVPGRAWSDADMQMTGQLARLASLLHRLHSCPAQLPPFRLDERVKAYACHLETSAAAQTADNICHMLAEVAASQDAVVCHNDPVAGNVIEADELHLIDFEFAAAGNPLFDLAAVIEHHRLPAASVDAFTEAYRRAGGQCDEQRLEQWRMIYCQTASLWNQIVAV